MNDLRTLLYDLLSFDGELPIGVRQQAVRILVNLKEDDLLGHVRKIVLEYDWHSRLPAIREVRERTGWGLVEAKKFVERVLDENGLRPPPR